MTQAHGGDPHYVAVLHVPDRTEIEVGALGTHEFPPGDYAYVGRAERGYDARLERHRRTSDKSIRWHVDYLRDRSRWVEARTPDATSECALADRLAENEGASRWIEGFGASDCHCSGHLVALPDADTLLPGALWRGDGIEATFVERPNRFVVRARLDDEIVRAFLPNTARLTELLEPGRPVLLEPADDPDRKTDYTVRRFWDGTWVSVEATRAERMVEELLRRERALPGVGAIEDFETQVEYEGHRFDLRLQLASETDVWLEVKSLSRNFDGTAVLSGTPSRRGVEHLEALAEIAAENNSTEATAKRLERDRPRSRRRPSSEGEDALAPNPSDGENRRAPSAAVAFVVQRGDAEQLAVGDPDIDAEIDPDWVDAVRRAREAGVTVLGFGCRVTPSNCWITRQLAVREVAAPDGKPSSR